MQAKTEVDSIQFEVIRNLSALRTVTIVLAKTALKYLQNRQTKYAFSFNLARTDHIAYASSLRTISFKLSL